MPNIRKILPVRYNLEKGLKEMNTIDELNFVFIVLKYSVGNVISSEIFEYRATLDNARNNHGFVRIVE